MLQRKETSLYRERDLFIIAASLDCRAGISTAKRAHKVVGVIGEAMPGWWFEYTSWRHGVIGAGGRRGYRKQEAATSYARAIVAARRNRTARARRGAK